MPLESFSQQTMNYQNWQLRPNTVYYLKPGLHIGNLSADTNDAFVGGYSGGTRTTLSGNYAGDPWAISSENADGVTIEYLTIEKYQPVVNQVAINQGGWLDSPYRSDVLPERRLVG